MMPDPLAITTDAQGKRWVRCPMCVGSGEVVRPVVEYTKTAEMEEVQCPACNGIGKQEIP